MRLCCWSKWCRARCCNEAQWNQHQNVKKSQDDTAGIDGNGNGCSHSGNRREKPQKIKNGTAIWSSNPNSEYLSENCYLKNISAPHVHCSIIWAVLSLSVASDSLQLHGLQSTRLLCPWDSSGENSGVGCHFLLQAAWFTIAETQKHPVSIDGSMGKESVGYRYAMGFPGGSLVKNPAASAGGLGSIPGLGRSPGGENGNLL